MTTDNIIRAWKDPRYRESLTEGERALLPEHPAGLVELSDSELDDAAGGLITILLSLAFGSCNIRCTGTRYVQYC